MIETPQTGDVAGLRALIFLAALAAIAIGFGLWALPAGLIVGGLEAVVVVIVDARGAVVRDEKAGRWAS